MTHQSFEDWRDSDDGPRHHDLSEGDLHNAFDAGMELGAQKEAALKDLDRLKTKILEAISTFEASISTAIEDDAIQRLSRCIEDIFDEEDDDATNRTILDAPYNDIEVRIAQFLDGPIIQLFGGQEDGKGQ